MRFAFAVAVIGMALSGTASAQGKQDFTLVNKTGYTIDKVFVSPNSSNDWEDDVLGRDVLSNGENIHITFSRGTQTCKWDLKVVYDDGESAEWSNVDLCQISSIAVSYDRSTGRTWAESN